MLFPIYYTFNNAEFNEHNNLLISQPLFSAGIKSKTMLQPNCKKRASLATK